MLRASLFACAAVCLVATIALGQGAAPAASAGGKRDACKQSVKAKGLRGTERLDAFQICLAEGRLDCVKQAVAQKVPKSDRKDFIMTCMGTAKAKADNKPENKPENKRNDEDEEQQK